MFEQKSSTLNSLRIAMQMGFAVEKEHKNKRRIYYATE